MSPRLALAGILLTALPHYALAPPYGEQGWIAFHVVAWIPALAVFSRLRGWRAFAAGWLTGTSVMLVIYAWLIETILIYTQLSLIAGIAVWLLYGLAHGLMTGLFAWGVAPLRRAAGNAWPFAVAAWFVVCEHWMPQFFPYYQGAGWVSVTQVYLLAAHTGVAGISFLVFLVNGLGLLVLESWLARNHGRLDTRGLILSGSCGVLCISLGLLIAAYQEGRIAAAEAEATPLRLALVQDNIKRVQMQTMIRNDPQAMARELVSFSEAALRADPQIRVIVWAEGALRSPPDAKWSRPVRMFASRLDGELWTGAITRKRERDGHITYYNSAYRIHAGGRIDPPYHKNTLVPISEALPSISWLPDFTRLVGAIQGVGQISAGQESELYDTTWGRVAFLICYEAILPDSMRQAVAQGAALLANFTYDAWFGDTRELDQHLSMVRAQVAQLGVPMVRATTTGISAFIDARGQVTARGGRYTREVIVSDTHPLHANGLYAEIGPWFAWLCSALILPLLLWSLRDAASNPSSTAPYSLTRPNQ